MDPVNEQRTKPELWQLLDSLSIGAGSLFVLAFLVILLIPRANFPVGVGLLILIVGLQFFLVHSRIRSFWLEVELLALVFFGLAIGQLTSSATSSKAFKYPLTETANASFTLPADKIQSDLTVLHPISNVMLLLISGQTMQNYNVSLTDIKGVGSQDHKPPYNKDVVEVDVSLPQGANGDMAANFASQLQSVKSIYLFPSTSPSPTPSLSNLTFALPVSKVGSDLNSLLCSLKVGSAIEVILVVNNQMQFYSAKVVSLPTPMSTSSMGCATPTPTTSTTSPPATIGIEVMNSDKATDLANQLPNATTIYLLQPNQMGS